jgi:hypothetical protein
MHYRVPALDTGCLDRGLLIDSCKAGGRLAISAVRFQYVCQGSLVAIKVSLALAGLTSAAVTAAAGSSLGDLVLRSFEMFE